MDQFSFMGLTSPVFTVAQLTQYLRDLIETDYRTQDVWVEGEVSNVSTPASGHLYFTLRDPEATLRCVMWRSQVARQRQLPQDGDHVEVHGRIGIYEAGGQYQLYADSVRPSGQGELYEAFLALKEKLEAEGLFDEARKRPLPSFPERIGIVTSANAAALQDALDVLGRRFPLAEVILSETPVQGVKAAEGIVQALHRLETVEGLDLILLIRGGGSMEDLAAFNDEQVARAIAASEIPIVSGVGHETDFTIADFVADLRAPTPSAAAEIVSPDQAELSASLTALKQQLAASFGDQIDREIAQLMQERARLERASPRAQMESARQRVDEYQRRVQAVMRQKIDLYHSQLAGRRDTLLAVGPPSVLARGYALVRDANGELLRSVDGLNEGDSVRVKLQHGAFEATVEQVEPEDELNDV